MTPMLALSRRKSAFLKPKPSEVKLVLVKPQHYDNYVAFIQKKECLFKRKVKRRFKEQIDEIPKMTLNEIKRKLKRKFR